MELRFILEHAEDTLATARKMFWAKDWNLCQHLLEQLGSYLVQQIANGVDVPPNIDVKPPEPE